MSYHLVAVRASVYPADSEIRDPKVVEALTVSHRELVFINGQEKPYSWEKSANLDLHFKTENDVTLCLSDVVRLEFRAISESFYERDSWSEFQDFIEMETPRDAFDSWSEELHKEAWRRYYEKHAVGEGMTDGNSDQIIFITLWEFAYYPSGEDDGDFEWDYLGIVDLPKLAKSMEAAKA